MDIVQTLSCVARSIWKKKSMILYYALRWESFHISIDPILEKIKSYKMFR